MRPVNMRWVILILSLCFTVVVMCVGGAKLACQQGVTEKNIEKIRLAEKLDPLASEYAYENYRLSGDLEALRRAMRLEPTKPAYHMYYGLVLLKQASRTQVSDQEAVIEICQAAKLKPYSKLYQNICEQCKTLIPVQADF